MRLDLGPVCGVGGFAFRASRRILGVRGRGPGAWPLMFGVFGASGLEFTGRRKGVGGLGLVFLWRFGLGTARFIGLRVATLGSKPFQPSFRALCGYAQNCMEYERGNRIL